MQVKKAAAASDAGKYQAYKRKHNITEPQLADADHHSTMCTGCQTICHDHCSLEEITSEGDRC